MPGPLRPRLATPALALLLGLLAVLAPAPADAHPFGAPQSVEVSGDDDAVRVRWRAGAADDVTALAAALGLVPDERVLLDGAVTPSDDDGVALAGAPAFADYLREHIVVRRGGATCRGDLVPLDRVGPDGAVLSFDCPAPSAGAAAAGAGGVGGPVDVTVSMLTDVHPAYRTLATGPDGQRAVYTDQDDTHRWTLGTAPAAAAPRLGRSAAVQLGSVGAVLLASVASGLVWIRRRGRRA